MQEDIGTSQHHQSHNDEIDLSQLILALWQGKWTVLATTALFMLFAVAYIVFVPKTYEGSLTLKTIDAIEESAYSDLSDLEILVVDADLLANSFVSTLSARSMLVESMIKTGYITQRDAENEEAFRTRAILQSYNDFVFSPISKQSAEGDFENSLFYTIDITTPDPVLAANIISNILSEATTFLKTRLTNEFNRLINNYNRKIDKQLYELKTQEKVLLSQFQWDLLVRKNQLKLNAAIARDLDLARGVHIQLVQNNNGAMDLGEMTSPKLHYTQGYIALEKELELLNAENFLLANSWDLKKVQEKISQFENDRTTHFARQQFDITPIAQGEFKAIHYDIGSIEFIAKSSNMVILLLSIILGGMIGVIVLVLYNVINKQDTE